MFIYSLRAGTIKFFGVICVALAALIVLVVFVPPYDGGITNAALVNKTEIKFDKIKDNADRIEFLKQFGWEASNDAVENEDITIPSDFDKIFSAYNEIQKKQGLDLSKYKKKMMVRYTYEITNYPDYDGKVYANILVYKNKVVGGDICSADSGGFIHGFESP